LDYILELIPSDFLPAWVSVNRRFFPAFQAWAEGKPVELVVEETQSEEEKLGAVGALFHLVELSGVEEDLLVLAGDNWLSLDLRKFVDWAEGKPAVALFPLGDPMRAKGRYGVAAVEGKFVRAFQEKPENPVSDLASTACYFFPKDVLALLEKFLREAPKGQDAPWVFSPVAFGTERNRGFHGGLGMAGYRRPRVLPRREPPRERRRLLDPSPSGGEGLGDRTLRPPWTLYRGTGFPFGMRGGRRGEARKRSLRKSLDRETRVDSGLNFAPILTHLDVHF
jgi:hypothetical protein